MLPGALVLALALAFAPPALAATLVYSNDVNGELEPCGCRNNPMGGMARKARMLKGLEDKTLLQLDAGDLLFDALQLPEALARQAELQASYLLKAHDLLGHDAVVPGEKDFALGLKAFDRLRKKAKLRFLAANLVRAKGGALLLPPNAIFKKGKLRVAVFGVVGESLPWPKELKATPALPAAREQAKKLRRKAELLIALTHQGYEADVALAQAVPEIDVIVGGHTQSFLQSPPKVGSTWIYQSSFRNQYVGVLPLAAPPTGEGHRLVGLDAGYEKPEDAAPAMVKLVAEFKAAVAELNAKEDMKLTRVDGPAGAEKFHTFPRCAECHLFQFDFWRKTPHANALEPLIKAGQARNKECLTCHTVGFGDRQGFSDVNALAERRMLPAPSPSPAGNAVVEEYAPSPTDPRPEPVAAEDLAAYLKQVHSAKSLKDEVRLVRADPEPADIRRSLGQLGRSWAPVQCENCHQPGRDHPFSGAYAKAVSNDACLKCHTAERAPQWYTKTGQPDWEKIAQKRVSITCPAGSFPEED
jgi:hypothetical protein